MVRLVWNGARTVHNGSIIGAGSRLSRFDQRLSFNAREESGMVGGKGRGALVKRGSEFEYP